MINTKSLIGKKALAELRGIRQEICELNRTLNRLTGVLAGVGSEKTVTDAPVARRGKSSV